jgi:hypothetical protein
VTRVEDVGRHRIVRATLGGHPINVVAAEGEALPAEAPASPSTRPRGRLRRRLARAGAPLSRPRGFGMKSKTTGLVPCPAGPHPRGLLAVIPLMTVVNYSVQDTFGQNEFFWNGLYWFQDLLESDRLWNALGRQLIFSAVILLIEVPLGVFVALNMPKKGFWASLCLVLMALPLLIPWNVVGTIWQIFGRVDIGLLGHTLDALGIPYNYTQNAVAAWITVVVMDVWHWTSLVALLAYAGCAPSPTPTIRRPRSTKRAGGRCSASSSCPRCGASW